MWSQCTKPFQWMIWPVSPEFSKLNFCVVSGSGVKFSYGDNNVYHILTCMCVHVSHPSKQTKELLVGSLLSAAIQDHVTQLLLFTQTWNTVIQKSHIDHAILISTLVEVYSKIKVLCPLWWRLCRDRQLCVFVNSPSGCQESPSWWVCERTPQSPN